MHSHINLCTCTDSANITRISWREPVQLEGACIKDQLEGACIKDQLEGACIKDQLEGV